MWQARSQQHLQNFNKNMNKRLPAQFTVRIAQ